MLRGVLRSGLLIAVSSVAFLIFGCSKAGEEYQTGIYWLEKENNWRMAARAFRRSLEHNPGRWRTHAKLLEALSKSDDPDEYEQQLRRTLAHFPDSARSPAVAVPSTAILGEGRYNRVASSFELKYIGDLIVSKGAQPELLARGIMAACRSKDSVAVIDYFHRFLGITGGERIPDSLTQELNFFIGPSQVKWLRCEWRLSQNPDDLEALKEQLDLGLVMGDSAATREILRKAAGMSPGMVKDPDFIKRFGLLAGFDPFDSRVLATGWDGSLSPDGSKVIYIKDMGTPGEPDIYIYQKPVGGGRGKPLMKALQQTLSSIAWPRFSPDGRWIYFYGSPDQNWRPGKIGRFNLYRIRPKYGSRPRRLTDADLLAVEPGFEVDGTVLLIARDVGSVRASVKVVRLDPETLTVTFLSRIGEPITGGAVFTPDCDSLLFLTDRGLFRRAVAGGVISVDLNWLGFWFPALSPDGGRLLMTNRAGQLLLVRRRDAATTFLGTAASSIADFGSDGRLLVTRMIGGKRRVVLLNLDKPVRSDVDFINWISS